MQPTNQRGGPVDFSWPPPLQPPNQPGGRKTRPDPKRHNTQVVLERFSVFVILERHQHRWSRKTTSHCMCLCLCGLTPRHKYKSVGVDDCPSTPVCVPILVLQRNSFVCLIKFFLPVMIIYVFCCLLYSLFTLEVVPGCAATVV